MQLDTWMKENDRNAVWVGNKANIPSYQIRRICDGTGDIGAQFIKDIAKLTRGAVNINDWVEWEKQRGKK